MEQTRPLPEYLARPAFSPDLVPLYQLTEQQYQAVVNQLANLTVAVIEHLQGQGQTELAQQLAGHAHSVLQDYDEDMAEHVQRLGSVQPSEELRQEQIVYTSLAHV